MGGEVYARLRLFGSPLLCLFCLEATRAALHGIIVNLAQLRKRVLSLVRVYCPCTEAFNCCGSRLALIVDAAPVRD